MGDGDAKVEVVEPAGDQASATSGHGSDAKLVLLSVAAMVLSLGFTAVQEVAFRLPNFDHISALTLITTVGFSFCGFVELLARRQLKCKAPLHELALLSVITGAALYCTNASLRHISYPTRIIFKGSKLLVILAASHCLGGRTYSRTHLAAAGCFSCTLVLFSLGDSVSLPRFSPLGLLLISAGVVGDAATALFEERRLFAVHQSSHCEIAAYAFGFSSVWTLGGALFTNGLPTTREDLALYRNLVPVGVIASILGYGGLACILLVIRDHGAPAAEVVKSLRKVFSVLLSFAIYPRAITQFHAFGIASFCAAVYLERLASRAIRKPG